MKQTKQEDKQKLFVKTFSIRLKNYYFINMKIYFISEQEQIKKNHVKKASILLKAH